MQIYVLSIVLPLKCLPDLFTVSLQTFLLPLPHSPEERSVDRIRKLAFLAFHLDVIMILSIYIQQMKPTARTADRA